MNAAVCQIRMTLVKVYEPVGLVRLPLVDDPDVGAEDGEEGGLKSFANARHLPTVVE